MLTEPNGADIAPEATDPAADIEVELGDSIILIPLDKRLHDSPFQLQVTSERGDLAGMADTMRPPHGQVLQPILVRPASPRTFAPGLGDEQWETVFGHRRRRAAELAGLQAIPARVCDMTDEQVRFAQAVENLQREDINPLDEADALQLLKTEHAASMEDLMARCGQGRTYVYNSLRLATCSDELRQLLAEGKVEREWAVELARLPNALQPLGIKELAHLSSRDVRSALQRNWSCRITVAAFDTEDAKLVPSAGACTNCEHRSDAEPSLVQQYGPSMCLHRECFQRKTVAAEVKARAALPPATLPPPAKPLTREQVAERQAQLPHDEEPAAGSEGASGQQQHEEQAPQEPSWTEAQVAVRERWPLVLRAILRRVARRDRTVDDLRFVVERELGMADSFGRITEELLGIVGVDGEEASFEQRQEWVAKADADQLALLLVMCSIEDGPAGKMGNPTDRIDAYVAHAQRFGVRPEKVKPEAGGKELPKGGKAKPAKPVRYLDPRTGCTWSGRGLQPKWLKVALEGGAKLSDFEVKPKTDTKTADMFEQGAGAS